MKVFTPLAPFNTLQQGHNYWKQLPLFSIINQCSIYYQMLSEDLYFPFPAPPRQPPDFRLIDCVAVIRDEPCLLDSLFRENQHEIAVLVITVDCCNQYFHTE